MMVVCMIGNYTCQMNAPIRSSRSGAQPARTRQPWGGEDLNRRRVLRHSIRPPPRWPTGDQPAIARALLLSGQSAESCSALTSTDIQTSTSTMSYGPGPTISFGKGNVP